MRAFVAVPLPPPLQTALAAYAAGAGVAGARVTPAEHLHVTVHFLGAVSNEDGPRLAEALAPACAGVGAFGLTVAEAAFSPARRPRMIWARLEASDAFTELATAVAGAAARFAHDAREPRTGRPHVTLARLRRPVPRGAELPPLPVAGTAVEVSACTLIRSELGPGGARYTTLATFPLGE